MRARFLLAAKRELQEAVGYYEHQQPGLGVRFRDQVFETLERIKQHPHAWSPLSKNTRRCRTHRFPYGLIYAIEKEEILVLAVAHIHREPEYWRNRR